MKAIFLFYLFVIFVVPALSAQDSAKYSISFKRSDNKKVDTLRRSKEKEVVWRVEIVTFNTKGSSVKANTIEIVADEKNTTLPADQYEIIPLKAKNLDELASSNIVRVEIKKENDAFKQIKPLDLSLRIIVKKAFDGKYIDDEEINNEGTPTSILLRVLPSVESLMTYKYLGYLGTNFDLVDGVQAKNLFFATNIFIPETRHWGFSLGLYGNRTLTRTDSSLQTTFQSRVDRINDTLIARYFDTALKLSTRVSDNIGAYFMPLIPLRFLGQEGPLKLYYAPQFEFIWRRTTIENLYQNSRTLRIDTTRNRYPANTGFPLTTPLDTKVNFNVYDAYLGLIAVLLRYETEEISIRLSSSVGINLNYVPLGSLSGRSSTGSVTQVYPTWDKQERNFFFSRLLITEPTTGLTLGAEMSNYFGSRSVRGEEVSKAQPYYNVTLSKAFDLKNLATVVKPLANR